MGLWTRGLDQTARRKLRSDQVTKDWEFTINMYRQSEVFSQAALAVAAMV